MNTTNRLSRFLLIAGYIAMLIGAIDPMEGSLLILPGSALVAIGTFLGNEHRGIIIYRLWSFFLIIIGVAALWVTTMLGGIGGDFRVLDVVGIILPAVPDRLVDGYLGPGLTALGSVVWHRRGDMVHSDDVSGDQDVTSLDRDLGRSCDYWRFHRCHRTRYHRRLHLPPEKAKGRMTMLDCMGTRHCDPYMDVGY